MENNTLEAKDVFEAIEIYFEQGWTDGLPVVPPTESRIQEFLNYAKLAPDEIIGEIPERDRVITAEKLVINAIMAGCKPEYMPVLIAAVEAITDPAFKFNHLASLGSPWPLMVICGPIVKELEINYGIWAMGPGARPNATIGRTLSLLVANCAMGYIGGIQRGTYGHPGRFNSMCIGENPEDFGWEPHHVEMGYDRNTSTVTLLSCYPYIQTPTSVQMQPERILATLSGSIAQGEFIRGVYPIIMGRPWAEVFVKEGWSKQDMKTWMVDNTKRSIASLKERGRWGTKTSQYNGYGATAQEVMPSDEENDIYIWKESEFDKNVFDTGAVMRQKGMYFIVTGGDAGSRVCWMTPYQFATNPVTKPIRFS